MLQVANWNCRKIEMATAFRQAAPLPNQLIKRDLSGALIQGGTDLLRRFFQLPALAQILQKQIRPPVCFLAHQSSSRFG